MEKAAQESVMQNLRNSHDGKRKKNVVVGYVVHDLLAAKEAAPRTSLAGSAPLAPRQLNASKILRVDPRESDSLFLYFIPGIRSQRIFAYLGILENLL
jgi:hypothetical protein